MESTLLDPPLLELLRKKDPKSIETLVKAHTRTLMKASRGLGFHEDQADELVQRVWTTFFEVISNFEGRSQVRTFLFGILYKKASELRRQEARFEFTDPLDAEMERKFKPDGHWNLAPLDPEQFSVSLEREGHLKDCLDRLPVQQKLAFFMREMEGNDTDTICESLNVKLSHVGVLLYRARNQLRNCLERKWKGE